eukprot:scaffold137006_cov39-Prasinocladus_malaysianus.AAC.1
MPRGPTIALHQMRNQTAEPSTTRPEHNAQGRAGTLTASESANNGLSLTGSKSCSMVPVKGSHTVTRPVLFEEARKPRSDHARPLTGERW